MRVADVYKQASQKKGRFCTTDVDDDGFYNSQVVFVTKKIISYHFRRRAAAQLGVKQKFIQKLVLQLASLCTTKLVFWGRNITLT